MAGAGAAVTGAGAGATGAGAAFAVGEGDAPGGGACTIHSVIASAWAEGGSFVP